MKSNSEAYGEESSNVRVWESNTKRMTYSKPNMRTDYKYVPRRVIHTSPAHIQRRKSWV